MISFISRLVSILIASAGIVTAGTVGGVCNTQDVTIPCEQSGWGFGADLLYMESHVPALGYYGSSLSEPGDERRFNHLVYTWDWGFKLQGTYYFGTGHNLDVNWYHITNSRTTELPNNLNIPFENTLTQNATGTISPRWDELDADFGQHIDLSERSRLNVHAGVEYTRVRFSGGYNAPGLTNSLVNFSGNVAVLRNVVFDGFGPRFGVNLAYGNPSGLACYAQTATALLIGHSYFRRQLTLGEDVLITKGKQEALVPELQAKAGLQYTYPMAQSDLIIDGGWFLEHYFHILRDGIASGVLHLSNFAIQGPYIGLRWVASTS